MGHTLSYLVFCLAMAIMADCALTKFKDDEMQLYLNEDTAGLAQLNAP